MTKEYFTQATYLAASVLFILGLKGLTRPDSAKRGVQYAAFGMLLAVLGTLVHHDVVRYPWIVAGLVLGTAIGYPLGRYTKMTAVPQVIAISHMFGALAATLVGIAEYYNASHGGGAPVTSTIMAALGFDVLFGALTVTGSFMAFGKLQEIVTGRPVTYRGQNAVNLALFGTAVLMYLYLIVAPGQQAVFYTMLAVALLIGVLMVLPIGSADMPVVVSLLNSYAGLAASATGFAIHNNVLIIAGALEGASGLLLSILMSRAMNRSFANVLFGAFGGEPAGGAAAGRSAAGLTVKSLQPEDAAIQLAYARSLVIIPGYGMAVAQAQQQVRELTELVEKRGGEVKFAVHPVAGRMPGHMSVLLAESQVDYSKIITEVDEANSVIRQADLVLVIGANDIVNPDADEDKASPLYGMPVFRPDLARANFVMKRSMAAGFAGVENPLFYKDNTYMLFGDAKKVVTSLVQEIKGMDGGGHF